MNPKAKKLTDRLNARRDFLAARARAGHSTADVVFLPGGFSPTDLTPPRTSLEKIGAVPGSDETAWAPRRR